MTELKDHLESSIKKHFGFLEAKGFIYSGAQIIEPKYPQDKNIICAYQSPRLYIDITWNDYGKSLTINLDYTFSTISKSQRHAYFEPLLEYLSQGEIKPLAPYVVPGMSITQLNALMQRRLKVFADGPFNILPDLSARLQEHLTTVMQISEAQLLDYRKWINGKSQDFSQNR